MGSWSRNERECQTRIAPNSSRKGAKARGAQRGDKIKKNVERKWSDTLENTGIMITIPSLFLKTSRPQRPRAFA